MSAPAAVLAATRWIMLAVLAAPAPAAAQRPAVAAGGAVFQPLLADPKEPQFFAAYLWERSPRLAPRLGSVGFGRTIGVVTARTWQVAIAAAVFSQFNLAQPTADLMNTDYRVGIPVTYRRGNLTTRAQLYHQSSHLGDEYMVRTNAERVDLTFEAAELLVSQQLAAWRGCGGGGDDLPPFPADPKPGGGPSGAAERPPRRLLPFGRGGAGPAGRSPRSQPRAVRRGGLGLSPGRPRRGGGFGGLWGAANLTPAGTTDWRLGWIGSVDGTVWLERHVGVRASGSWAQDSISNAALTGRGKFKKFTHYSNPGPGFSVPARPASLLPYLGGGGRPVSVPQPVGCDNRFPIRGTFRR